MRNLSATLALLSAISCASLPMMAGEPADSAEATTPLTVGTSLPRLQLTSSEGQPFDLNAAVAAKPTILILYRGGW